MERRRSITVLYDSRGCVFRFDNCSFKSDRMYIMEASCMIYLEVSTGIDSYGSENISIAYGNLRSNLTKCSLPYRRDEISFLV